MSPRNPPRRTALVAGAGGYLGVAISAALVQSGWAVRGLVRRSESRERVAHAGATPIVGSVLEPAAVETASRGCDLLVHVAAVDSSGPDGVAGAEKVRVEGCRNLVRAARVHGVRRLVVGSGYWVYADNPGIITENSGLDPRGESRINRGTELAAMEAAASGSLEVLVVRPGMVYGNGSWFRPVVKAIRDGTYRYIGDGSNPWSFVSVEDAGSGFARLAEAGSPGEVYNLVDGRPAPWKEFGDLVADQLARPRPGFLSPSEAVSQYGSDVAHHLQARRACSAAKIEGLGWKPRHTSFREGLTSLLPRMIASDAGSSAGPRARSR